MIENSNSKTTKTILKDIGTYKSKMIQAFLASSDICEALLGENYTADDVNSLEYTRIFPFLYLKTTPDEAIPYLCVEADIPELQSGAMKNMRITVWVLCHKNCMKYAKTGYIGTRTDILSDMIERLFNGSYEFGIGKLHLDSASHLSNTNENYYGRQLIFSVPDFKVKG